MSSLNRSSLCYGAALFAVAACLALPVRAEDGPPIDVTQMLRQLKTMKEQQTLGVKATKRNALQQVSSAANDPSKALELWEEAVRVTQFNGAPKEGTAFHDWKAGEGEALKERECQSALHLYFTWLSLTLQRASGSEVKDLLPAIVNYTKEAAADQAAMEGFDDAIKREKEMEASRRHGGPRRNNDELVKRLHDQILKQATSGSVVVQWLRISDLLNDAGTAKPKPAEAGQPAGATWEHSPGNVDGIFQKIILPELRIEKDPRIVDYWDMKLRLEADAATKAKLSFEADKFNQVRMPQLLWNRAQDVLAIGQKNRAVADMFKIIQKYPAHPDAATWMASLEQTLLPPIPAAPAPSAPAAVTSVPAPVITPVPAPATTPAIPVTPGAPAPAAALPSAYPPVASGGLTPAAGS